jgi:thioredoxin 1
MRKIIILATLLFCAPAFAETILLEFYADWCPPCQQLKPVVDKTSKDLVLKVDKINIDFNPKLADAFGVDRIPTLILIKNGKVVLKIIGFVDEETLKSQLKPHLK